MQTPIGPSLQLFLGLCSISTEVPLCGLQAAWERWIGPERFRRKLRQFEQAGWIRVSQDGGGVGQIVKLTEEGQMRAWGGRDPELCWQRGWDGRWRLVVYDVPENQRKLRIRFNRKLRALHFGNLQYSVWLTPDPLEGFTGVIADTPPDFGILAVFDTIPGGSTQDAKLVAAAWDFGRINQRYRQYLELLSERPARWEHWSEREWFAVEWKAWNRAVEIDPLLPAVLLPSDYLGREAWLRRKASLESLARN